MRQMKMGELARESGVTRSAIHRYLRMGLLPEPTKSGLNIRLYDDLHLAILKEIRRLRQEQRMPLNRIKEVINECDWEPKAVSLETGIGNARETAIIHRRSPKDEKKSQKREQMLATATQLFSEKGYENFKIGDLAESLQMSRSTFYVYFEDKEELLSACIERLGRALIPIRDLESVLNEEDLFKRTHKRLEAFVKFFPTFRGILNLAKGLAGRENTRLSEKAVEAFKLLVLPVKKDLEQAAQMGLIRSIDLELMSYMGLGMAESLAYRLALDSRYSLEEATEVLMDFYRYGLSKPEESGIHPNGPEPLSAEILDLEGEKTMVTDIRFNGQSQLEARIGRALAKVDPHRLSSLSLEKGSGGLDAVATMKDGQKRTLRVADDITLEGEHAVGHFSIPLKHVSRIVFDP